MKNDLIDELMSVLTGDKETDLTIIKSYIQRYKNENKEYDPEVLNTFNLLLEQYVDKDFLKNINEYQKSMNEKISQTINDAKDKLESDEYESAKEILDELVEIIYPKLCPINTDDIVYLDFIGPKEEALYYAYFLKDKEIRKTSLKITELFYLSAYVNLISGNEKNFLKMIELSLTYCPTFFNSISLLVEYHFNKKNFKKMFEYLKMGFRFVTIEEQIIKLFQYLELYLVETGKYKEAYNVLNVISAYTEDQDLIEFVDKEREYLNQFIDNFDFENDFTLNNLFGFAGFNDNIFSKTASILKISIDSNVFNEQEKNELISEYKKLNTFNAKFLKY